MRSMRKQLNHVSFGDERIAWPRGSRSPCRDLRARLVGMLGPPRRVISPSLRILRCVMPFLGAPPPQGGFRGPPFDLRKAWHAVLRRPLSHARTCRERVLVADAAQVASGRSRRSRCCASVQLASQTSSPCSVRSRLRSASLIPGFGQRGNDRTARRQTALVAAGGVLVLSRSAAVDVGSGVRAKLGVVGVDVRAQPRVVQGGGVVGAMRGRASKQSSKVVPSRSCRPARPCPAHRFKRVHNVHQARRPARCRPATPTRCRSRIVMNQTLTMSWPIGIAIAHGAQRLLVVKRAQHAVVVRLRVLQQPRRRAGLREHDGVEGEGHEALFVELRSGSRPPRPFCSVGPKASCRLRFERSLLLLARLFVRFRSSPVNARSSQHSRTSGGDACRTVRVAGGLRQR